VETIFPSVFSRGCSSGASGSLVYVGGGKEKWRPLPIEGGNWRKVKYS